jgi:hypothetical protein
MRARTIAGGFVLAAAAVGCALIGGFPERSGTFCATREHLLCEDFDNPNAAFAWNRSNGRSGPLEIEAGLDPRAKSPPNGWGMRTPPVVADARIAMPFVHNFPRGPDGFRAGFSFFIEKQGVTATGSPVNEDAGDLHEGTLVLFLVRWATGQVALTVRADGLYLVYTALDTQRSRPILPKSTRINKRNAVLIGAWIKAEVTVDLREPSITVSGPDGPELYNLPVETKQSADKFTEVLFGTVAYGPSEQNDVLFDDIYLDFER